MGPEAGGDGSSGANGAVVSDAGVESGSRPAPESGADAPARGRAMKTWDWTGIVGTGQSLSVGAQGTPIAATKQPFHNLKLSLGTATVPPFDPTSRALSMVPLTEPVRPLAQTYPTAYPDNVEGETPHTAMASQISALFEKASGGDEYVTVHTVVGESGQSITALRRGATEVVKGATSIGRAYAATLFEAAAIARLAAAAGKTYGIGAIIVTHGETDAGSASYEGDLVQLWSDYQRDLLATTGQKASIPMLVTQQQSVPQGPNTTASSTLAQWRIGVDHPGDIVCSGPKYSYPYAADSVHLTTRGYELLGEKYAQVYFEKVVLGRDWQPLQPTSAKRAGNDVTVHFHVPVAPLAWNDSLPSPHAAGIVQWARGRGFEVIAGGAPVSITSVAIAGNAVRITCDRDLTGLAVVVSYAYTADGAPMPGGTARWGHLRDSDPFVGSMTGTPQANDCVTFSMAVP